MLRPNQRITLSPYKFYKNDQSKNEPVGYGKDKEGREYLKFQFLDVNRGEKDRTITGYMYLNVYTNLPLKVNDSVTVDEIVSVQVKAKNFKRPITIVGITIKETDPNYSMKVDADDEFVMPSFGVDDL